MHPTDLPADVVARIVARRGRAHVYDRLVPARTALVVIDMQHVFTAPGAALEVPLARGIVPAINRMADALRAAGGLVVWVRSAFPPTDRDWTVFFEVLNPPAVTAPLRAVMQIGAEGHALTEGLAPDPADLQFDKDRFSAFIPGACALPDDLRARGIDTVLIAGTLTNVCCESSARDAMMENFRVVMLSDANATRSDAEHMASLINIATTFGDVQTVEEAVGFLSTAR